MKKRITIHHDRPPPPPQSTFRAIFKFGGKTCLIDGDARNDIWQPHRDNLFVFERGPNDWWYHGRYEEVWAYPFSVPFDSERYWFIAYLDAKNFIAEHNLSVDPIHNEPDGLIDR